MNNLLIWPLTEKDKIIFSSSVSSLASITCCDPISISLKTEKQEYLLLSNVMGCQLGTFKQDLLLIVNRTNLVAQLQKSLFVCISKLGQILVEIKDQDSTIAYFLVDLETIQAWATQLDLLEVVMQENENEKNSKGTGCC